jgi:rod shape-determining protein MreC
MLVMLAFVLTIWQHRARANAQGQASQVSFPERVAAGLLWPLQKTFAATGAAFHNTGVVVLHSRSLAAENARMRARLDELEAQKLKLTDAYFENLRIKKILGFAPDGSVPGVPARVVAVNFGLSRKRLTIAAPPGRELEVGNVVRTAAGLVGRVVDASGNRGEVFPLLDAEHAVSATIVRSRDQGMVRVASQADYLPDALVMDKVMGHADVRQGDVVVTSGLGEVYPPGIPIGVVVGVRRSTAGTVDLTAIIRPYVDFDHLEWVLVERHGK